MRIMILGVAGTFMGGVACLAKSQGHEVIGYDQGIYPPMSLQLASLNIPVLLNDTDAINQLSKIDLVIVGNHYSRGNKVLEIILNKKIPYTSGPRWIYDAISSKRKTIVVSGTHGKTTTTSLIAWIMEYAKLNPGFLIGGVCKQFPYSARLGQEWFVIEGDEYDTCFDDKRPKFMHYHPDILLINNIEFDHADIYADLAAIQLQFGYVIRTVPSEGHVILPYDDKAVEAVVSKSMWSNSHTFGMKGAEWALGALSADGSHFHIFHHDKDLGEVKWQLLGKHNALNALAAIAVCFYAGIEPQIAMQALQSFEGVYRRLEMKGKVSNITIYDDFAHHPTAIDYSLQALRQKIKKSDRIFALLELGSYTLRRGYHGEAITKSLAKADEVCLYLSETDTFTKHPFPMFHEANQLLDYLTERLKPGDHVLMMSSRGFDGLHEKLLTRLSHV